MYLLRTINGISRTVDVPLNCKYQNKIFYLTNVHKQVPSFRVNYERNVNFIQNRQVLIQQNLMRFICLSQWSYQDSSKFSFLIQMYQPHIMVLLKIYEVRDCLSVETVGNVQCKVISSDFLFRRDTMRLQQILSRNTSQICQFHKHLEAQSV